MADLTHTRVMPLPERRKPPSLAILVEVFLRQGVPCAGCGETLALGAFDMDHIQPLDALGKQTPDNWQALCTTCHAEKTRVDLARARKGARLRGEAGQLKLRRELGPALVSRNDLKGRATRPIPARGFDTSRPSVRRPEQRR